MTGVTIVTILFFLRLIIPLTVLLLIGEVVRRHAGQPQVAGGD